MLDTLIKPKRLRDDLNAILLNKHIVLDFNVSSVIFPYNTGYANPVQTSHKELFSEDDIIPTEVIGKKFDFSFIDSLVFSDCLINNNDLTIFSSLSASGEDEFFLSNIAIENKLFTMNSYGLTYVTLYETPKTVDGTISFTIDYNSIYYLFQMFKHLSGKKTDKLFFSKHLGVVYLTNENREFYIAIDQNNTVLKFKSTCVKMIDHPVISGGDQTMKTLISEKASSTHKHLLRPFGDTVIMNKENKIFDQLASGDYKLWLIKPKKQ